MPLSLEARVITEEEGRSRLDIEVAYERVAVAYVKARAWVYDVYPMGVPILADLTPNEQCRLLELSLAEEDLAEIKATWRVELP